MSASGAEELIEAARTSLEAGDHAGARSKLRSALAEVPSDDADLMTELLSVSVEAAVAAGEAGEALAHQLDLITLVEAGGDAYSIGEEYERLGELHFERASADLTPESVMDADDAFASAHAKYVEADGPNTTDALDALFGRLRVAHLGADIEGLGDHAHELVAGAAGIEGGPRIKARVAGMLDQAAGLCREFGCDEEADALGEASAKLTGKPYKAPPKLDLNAAGGGGGGGRGGGAGGLAALLGGGGGADDDGDDVGLGGIDALLRATSSAGRPAGPGKKRSERLLDLLERAQVDGDLRVDAPRRIAKLEGVAQRYVALVFERNAQVSDQEAGEALRLTGAELSAALVAVDALLDELLP